MSPEELARRRKELTMDHDRTILDDDTDLGGECLARALTQGGSGSGSGSSFHGRSQDINLSDIMSSVQETEDIEPAGHESQEVASSAPTPAPKAKGKAFDKMTQVSAKIRSEQAALADLEVTLKTRKEEAEKALADLSEKTVECLEEVQVEKSLVEKRLKFLNLVLLIDGYTEQDLTQEIHKLVANDESNEKEDRLTQLKNAPPCPSFLKLSCLKSLLDGLQSYWTCDTSQKLFLGKRYFRVCSLCVCDSEMLLAVI